MGKATRPEPRDRLPIALSLSHSLTLSVCTLSTHTHTVTCSLAHLHTSARSGAASPFPPLTIFAIMRQFLFSVLFNVFFFALLSQLVALFIAFAFALFTLLKCAQLICLSVSSSLPLSLSFCRVFSPTHSVYFYQLLQASQIDSAAR